MTLRVRGAGLVFGAVAALVAARALADPPPPPCEIATVYPWNGATAVSPEGRVEYTLEQACRGTQVTAELRNAAGLIVAVDRGVAPTPSGSTLTLVPKAPLSVGEYEIWFSVPVNNTDTCPSSKVDASRVRFQVGAAPTVLAARFYQEENAVYGVGVSFSEPVAIGEAAPRTYVDVVGTSPSELSLAGSGLYWGFKGNAPGDRPRADAPLTIRIRSALPFASGSSLPNDFELTVKPEDYRIPWRPGDPVCRTGSGCSASGAGLLPWALLGLLLPTYWGIRRRRSSRR